MSVESPIFPRKYKIKPDTSVESFVSGSGWIENEKNNLTKIYDNDDENENNSIVHSELNKSNFYVTNINNFKSEESVLFLSSSLATHLKTLNPHKSSLNENNNFIKSNEKVLLKTFEECNCCLKNERKKKSSSLSLSSTKASKKKSPSVIGKQQHPTKCFCKFSLKKLPWILLMNSIIQVIVFNLDNNVIFDLLVYSPLKRNEIWRFLSYNFLHSGWIHLSINIFIQILLAIPLEIEQGHLRVFIIYFGGVIVGALGVSIFQPTLLMVGASAGVYSLLISHIPHVVMNFKATHYRYFRLTAVAILCASDIIFVVNHCIKNGNAEPKISYIAHGSGGIAGFLLGFAVYSFCDNGDDENNLRIFKALKYVSIVFITGTIIVAVVFNFNLYLVKKLGIPTL